MANRGSVLAVNDYLRTNDFLRSPSGRFSAYMQSDGNLCVYDGPPTAGGFRWGPLEEGAGEDDYFAILQPDGNLVVYRGTGPADNRGPVWSAHTHELPRVLYFLIMQDDGNLCVYRGMQPTPESHIWSWMVMYAHTLEEQSNWTGKWGDIGKAAKAIWSQAAGGVTSGAATVAGGVKDLAGEASPVAKSAWTASSQTASGLAEGASQQGMTISEDFIVGAEAAKAAHDAGTEGVRSGLVQMGNYTNEHACSLFVGPAVTAVIAASMGSGPSAVPYAGLLAASQIGNEIALRTCSGALAVILAGPVSDVPGVGFSRNELQPIIAFLIYRAMKGTTARAAGNPSFLTGALSYGLTELICKGTLPGGYSVWVGGQSHIPTA